MWWSDMRAGKSWRFIRLIPVLAIAGLSAGCFQPLYGEHSITGGNESIAQAMRGVDVPEIKTPRGTRIDRVGFEVRNNLIYGLTGGHGATSATHRLAIDLRSNQQQIIVDPTTGRANVSNYGIDADYTLTDLATGKVVVRSVTSARVSFDIPGQQQRFAGERGLRDAENRAAAVIAESIRNRLASYFTAGT
jgi:LPS-assembly lipoprotein